MTSFFYNPNIHPEEEYEKRKAALSALAKDRSVELIIGEYQPDLYFDNVRDKEGRCIDCYRLRLDRAAITARDRGIDAFSSTLMVSTYQNQEWVKQAGEDAAGNYGLEFIYSDLRENFHPAKKEYRETGSYLQNYCGCIYSLEERNLRQAEKPGKRRTGDADSNDKS